MTTEPEISNGARKKRTKRWCRGKEGVEHTPELVVNHNYQDRTCRWFPWWTGSFQNRRIHKWTWWCAHSLRCSVCGKYTEWSLKDRTMCPDYVEREQL